MQKKNSTQLVMVVLCKESIEIMSGKRRFCTYWVPDHMAIEDIIGKRESVRSLQSFYDGQRDRDQVEHAICDSPAYVWQTKVMQSSKWYPLGQPIRIRLTYVVSELCIVWFSFFISGITYQLDFQSQDLPPC